MKRSVILVALAGVVLAVGACSARRGAPIAGPFTPSDAEVARGQRVYQQHCDACHTRGDAALGPALNNKPLPQFLIRFQVRHGIGAMPAFDATQISDAELKALARYVVERRRHGR